MLPAFPLLLPLFLLLLLLLLRPSSNPTMAPAAPTDLWTPPLTPSSSLSTFLKTLRLPSSLLKTLPFRRCAVVAAVVVVSGRRRCRRRLRHSGIELMSQRARTWKRSRGEGWCSLGWIRPWDQMLPGGVPRTRAAAMVVVGFCGRRILSSGDGRRVR